MTVYSQHESALAQRINRPGRAVHDVVDAYTSARRGAGLVSEAGIYTKTSRSLSSR